MRGALLVLALALVAVAAGWMPGQASTARMVVATRVAPAQVGPPKAMAALGDSFNTGLGSTTAGGDVPSMSWSTGSRARVASLYSRLLRRSLQLRGRAHLVARDGSKVRDLARQASRAADLRVGLVTIQSGGNDLCGARDRDHATSPIRFRASVEAAFAVLRRRLPDARVLVTSITDEARWNDTSVRVGNTEDLADGTFCDPLVDRRGDPDAVRRTQIQAQERRYNAILADVCRQDPHCRYDGGAFFRLTYRPVDISPYSAFHPSVTGLARLAATAWRVGFDYADVTPPRVAATVRSAPEGLRVTLRGSDAAAVAGIEYRLDGRPYATYGRAVTLHAGQRLEYRAVDRNGNTSATYALVG